MGAQTQFQEGTAEVELLLQLHGRGDPRNVDQDNALLRAAVVLLVSHFEAFLKQIAEDFIDAIGTGAIEARQIPQGVRELHTIPRLNEIVQTSSAESRAALLKKLQPLAALWTDSSKPPAGTLKPAKLSRQVTNADHKTIDKLFGLMGSEFNVCDGDVDIPSGDDGTMESFNIQLGLTDVVKCRNDVAHGGIERKPTQDDLDRYVNFLRALADRLQRKADALISLYGPA